MNKMLVWLGLIVLILGLLGTVVAYQYDTIMDTGNEEIGDTQWQAIYGGIGLLIVGVVIFIAGLALGGPAPAPMEEEYERTCPECGALVTDPTATECLECGAPLEPMEDVRRCPECDAVIADPYATECAECGAPLSFDEEEGVSCGECGAMVEDSDASECEECGAPLPEEEEEEEIDDEQVECPNCGGMIPADASECSICGVEFEDEEEE